MLEDSGNSFLALSLKRGACVRWTTSDKHFFSLSKKCLGEGGVPGTPSWNRGFKDITFFLVFNKLIKQGAHTSAHTPSQFLLYFIFCTIHSCFPSFYFLCFNFPLCSCLNFEKEVFLDVPITTNMFLVLEFCVYNLFLHSTCSVYVFCLITCKLVINNQNLNWKVVFFVLIWLPTTVVYIYIYFLE